jgi:hypothetical protein
MELADRARYVRGLILDAVSNDFEDFESVFSSVRVWAEEKGLQVTGSQVWSELVELLRDGVVIAYHLTPTAPPEVVSRVQSWSQSSGHFYLLAQELRSAQSQLQEL